MHEIRNGVLVRYSGEFEVIGEIFNIGEHKQSTVMRFENIEAHETYIIIIIIDCDNDVHDTIFMCFFLKFYKSLINIINRSEYEKH